MKYFSRIVVVAFFVLFACSQFGLAQIVYPVQLQIAEFNPPYSPYLSDYTNYRSQDLNLYATLRDPEEAELKIMVRTSIKKNFNTVAISGFPNSFAEINGFVLRKGVPKKISGRDLKGPLADRMKPNSSGAGSVYPLETGIYQVCFQAHRLGNAWPVIVSEERCKTIDVKLYPAPLLTFPVKEAKLYEGLTANTQFSWQTSGYYPGGNFSYHFELREVPAGIANINDNFNQFPLVLAKTVQQTSYNYKPSDPKLDPKKKYAWRIQVQDMRLKTAGGTGYEPFRNKGVSEIRSFSVLRDVRVGDRIKMGEFWVDVTKVTVNPTERDKITGKGKVWVKFLNTEIAVEYTDLKVKMLVKEGEYQGVTGDVFAMVDDKTSLTPKSLMDYSGDMKWDDLTRAKNQEIRSFFEKHKDRTSAGVKKETAPHLLPRTQTLDNSFYSKVQMAVFRMKFTPTKAYANIATCVGFKKLHDYSFSNEAMLSFGKKGMEVSQTGISEKIAVPSDVKIPGTPWSFDNTETVFGVNGNRAKFVYHLRYTSQKFHMDLYIPKSSKGTRVEEISKENVPLSLLFCIKNDFASGKYVVLDELEALRDVYPKTKGEWGPVKHVRIKYTWVHFANYKGDHAVKKKFMETGWTPVGLLTDIESFTLSSEFGGGKIGLPIKSGNTETYQSTMRLDFNDWSSISLNSTKEVVSFQLGEAGNNSKVSLTSLSVNSLNGKFNGLSVAGEVTLPFTDENANANENLLACSGRITWSNNLASYTLSLDDAKNKGKKYAPTFLPNWRIIPPEKDKGFKGTTVSGFYTNGKFNGAFELKGKPDWVDEKLHRLYSEKDSQKVDINGMSYDWKTIHSNYFYNGVRQTSVKEITLKIDLSKPYLERIQLKTSDFFTKFSFANIPRYNNYFGVSKSNQNEPSKIMFSLFFPTVNTSVRAESIIDFKTGKVTFDKFEIGGDEYFQFDCDNDKWPETPSVLGGSAVNSGDVVKVGRFKIKATQVSGGNGTGTVFIPFYNRTFNVSFNGVTVNSSKELVGGTIEVKQDANRSNGLKYKRTKNSQNSPFEYDYLEHSAVNGLVDLSKKSSERNTLPLGLPEELTKPLGIEDPFYFESITFSKGKVEGKLRLIKLLKSNQYVKLGETIKLRFDGFSLDNTKLYLDQEYLMDEGCQVVLAGDPQLGASSKKGELTFVVVSCNGLGEFTLKGKVELPKNVMASADPTNNPEVVSGRFSYKGKDLNKFIVPITFETKKIFFQNPNLRGYYADLTKAYWDNDDTKAVEGSSTVVGFRGVVANELNWYLPTNVTNANKPIYFEAKDLSISGTGVTFSTKQDNLLTFENGKINTWQASLSGLEINVEKGNVKTNFLQGTVLLPISNSDVAHALKYKATWEVKDATNGDKAVKTTSLKFAFDKEDLNKKKQPIPSFGSVSLALGETSTLSAAIDESGIGLPSASLNGTLVLSGGATPFSIPLKVDGFNLNNAPDSCRNPISPQLESISMKTIALQLLGGDVKFADFPVKLSKFEFRCKDSAQYELGATINVDLVKLDGDGEDKASFSGTGHFHVDLKKDGKKGFRFADFGVKALLLEGSWSTASLTGSLIFFKESESTKYGNGFKAYGSLEMKTGIEFKAAAAIQFGSTRYSATAKENKGDKYYRYFFADILASSKKGIPIGNTSLFVNGIGGGVFYNIERDGIADSLDVMVKKKGKEAANSATVSSASNASDNVYKFETLNQTDEMNVGTGLSGNTYTPSDGALGIKFSLTGYAISQEVVDISKASIYFQMRIKPKFALESIYLDSEVGFMPTPNVKDPKDKSGEKQGKGLLVAQWDIKKSIIAASGGFYFRGPFFTFGTVQDTEYVSLSKSVVKQKMEVKENQNENHFISLFAKYGGSNKYWFFKFGSPKAMVPAAYKFPAPFDRLGELKAEAYFMAGHKLPAMPSLAESLGDIGKDRSLLQGLPVGGPPPSRNAEALYFGLKFGAKLDAKFLFLSASMQVLLGMDIGMIHQDTLKCNGEVKTSYGLNNWRAKGRAYAYLRAKIGIDIDLAFIKGNFTIFDAQLLAYMQAEMPDPSYIVGAIRGKYSILDGMVSGKFNYKAEIGKPCSSETPNPMADFPAIASTFPENKGKMEIFESADVVFNFSMGKYIMMEEIIDVKTFESKTRTFRPVYKGVRIYKGKHKKALGNPDSTLINANSALKVDTLKLNERERINKYTNQVSSVWTDARNYPTDPLEPNTDYTFVYTVTWQELDKNGKWNLFRNKSTNKPYYEHKIVEARTQGLPETIHAKMLSYRLPEDNQRNWHPGYGKAMLELRSPKYSYLTSRLKKIEIPKSEIPGKQHASFTEAGWSIDGNKISKKVKVNYHAKFFNISNPKKEVIKIALNPAQRNKIITKETEAKTVTAANSKTTFYSTVSKTTVKPVFNYDQINSDLSSQFVKGDIYRLEFVQTIDDPILKGEMGTVSGNVYKGDTVTGTEMNFKTKTMKKVSHKKLRPLELFKYHFRVSTYASLSSKLEELFSSISAQEVVTDGRRDFSHPEQELLADYWSPTASNDAIYFLKTLDEGFDKYDQLRIRENIYFEEKNPFHDRVYSMPASTVRNMEYDVKSPNVYQGAVRSGGWLAENGFSFMNNKGAIGAITFANYTKLCDTYLKPLNEVGKGDEIRHWRQEMVFNQQTNKLELSEKEISSGKVGYISDNGTGFDHLDSKKNNKSTAAIWYKAKRIFDNQLAMGIPQAVYLQNFRANKRLNVVDVYTIFETIKKQRHDNGAQVNMLNIAGLMPFWESNRDAGFDLWLEKRNFGGQYRGGYAYIGKFQAPGDPTVGNYYDNSLNSSSLNYGDAKVKGKNLFTTLHIEYRFPKTSGEFWSKYGQVVGANGGNGVVSKKLKINYKSLNAK